MDSGYRWRGCRDVLSCQSEQTASIVSRSSLTPVARASHLLELFMAGIEPILGWPGRSMLVHTRMQPSSFPLQVHCLLPPLRHTVTVV